MQFMILKKMACNQHNVCDIMGTYTACFLGMLIDQIRSDYLPLALHVRSSRALAARRAPPADADDAVVSKNGAHMLGLPHSRNCQRLHHVSTAQQHGLDP